MADNKSVDPWRALRDATQARIGLGRVGSALPTSRWLELQTAHALAREAVLRPWDVAALSEALMSEGEACVTAPSQALDRATFLRRPDLGRSLSAAGASTLRQTRAKDRVVLAFAVSDGLSAKAIDAHFLPFWRTFRCAISDLTRAPIALCPFGRVAISDEVGEAFSARMSIIFVGERPGLSASDSMGVYLTYGPKKSNNDAMRNCISNVRAPHGLSYELAAHKLNHLIRKSLDLALSGVALKEDAPTLLDRRSSVGQLE